jgi:hypothetical protein
MAKITYEPGDIVIFDTGSAGVVVSDEAILVIETPGTGTQLTLSRLELLEKRILPMSLQDIGLLNNAIKLIIDTALVVSRLPPRFNQKLDTSRKQ